MSFWFAFAHILRLGAESAMAKVDAEFALAIHVVQDREGLASVAGKVAAGAHQLISGTPPMSLVEW